MCRHSVRDGAIGSGEGGGLQTMIRPIHPQGGRDCEYVHLWAGAQQAPRECVLSDHMKSCNNLSWRLEVTLWNDFHWLYVLISNQMDLNGSPNYKHNLKRKKLTKVRPQKVPQHWLLRGSAMASDVLSIQLVTTTLMKLGRNRANGAVYKNSARNHIRSYWQL